MWTPGELTITLSISSYGLPSQPGRALMWISAILYSDGVLYGSPEAHDKWRHWPIPMMTSKAGGWFGHIVLSWTLQTPSIVVRVGMTMNCFMCLCFITTQLTVFLLYMSLYISSSNMWIRIGIVLFTVPHTVRFYCRLQSPAYLPDSGLVTGASIIVIINFGYISI